MSRGFSAPDLDPRVILKIAKVAEMSKLRLPGGSSRARKAWVMDEIMPDLRGLQLPKVPAWLRKPVLEAAVSVIIDTVWALGEDREDG